MRHPLAVYTAKLGHRGRALLYLAALWAVIGATLLLRPDSDPDHVTLLELLPMHLRVAIWWAAAAVAALTAWWPPGRTKWGFVALVVPVAFRTLSYAFSVALGAATGERWGHVGDWDIAVAWALVTGFVMLLAGWPEHVRLEDREG